MKIRKIALAILSLLFLSMGLAHAGVMTNGSSLGGGGIIGNGGGSSYTLPTASTTVLGGVRIDGTSITIGTTGIISAVTGSSSITTGTTTVTGGTSTRILFNNVGVVGEYAISGTGSVCMTTNCVLTTPNLGTPSAAVLTNATGTAAGLTAGNVTTNANLTGVITSVGNATSIASQTGSGTKFVVDNTPTLITPVIGAATGTSIVLSSSATASSFNATTPNTGYQMNGATGIMYPSVDSITDGTIAIGSQAFSNPSTSAAYNSIAIGEQALSGSLTTAALKNIAIGFQAGNLNTSGHDNISVGYQAGSNAHGPTTGNNNVMVGSLASVCNTCSNNTNIGWNAYSGTGSGNVTIGHNATTANNGQGVAIGSSAAAFDQDTIVGFGAGTAGRVGGGINVAVGVNALHAVTSGSKNVAIGPNVANGTLTTGSNNIFIGTHSGVTSQASGSINTLNIGNLIYGINIGTTGTTPAGNIGIGTTSPQNSTTLHVVGTAELGQVGSTLGQLLLAGSTSGLITEQPQAAAGTYNWNLPTTAGTSGQPLLSGGGGSTAMTWGQTGAGAEQMISFQPGLITAVTNTKGVFGKFVKASTVDNIVASAVTFTCAGNPTITMYECSTDATCASPTTIGSATVTASGQAFDGSISNAAITAGDYVAWAISAGTCTALDISATAQVHAN